MEGCDAKIRYHEARGDFSASNSSRARISLRQKKFSVFIDERNTGEWQECYSADIEHMPPDWHLRARLGLTATTGALADNHDVLSLKTFDNALEATLLAHSQTDTRRTSELQKLQHHMEYQITAVSDALKANLRKLAEQEDQAEARVEKLENKLTDQLISNIAERIEDIEGVNLGKMDMKRRKLDERIKALEQKVHRKLNERIAHLEKTMGGMIFNDITESSKSWLIPFAVLCLVVLVICGITLQKYFKVKKQHAL
eukprot:TRINITY_DN67325_c7_g2_i1.p1 TRINITY_DN67325_c7_g2~~TRINITY_DN67325_c7_g2_i1.p1  ORF type:complete len:256 (+),score=40.23 TRINITY_DN67325_c7_g2_i1:588-1355(+)